MTKGSRDSSNDEGIPGSTPILLGRVAKTSQSSVPLEGVVSITTMHSYSLISVTERERVSHS